MPDWKISLTLFSLVTGVFIPASALSQPIVPKTFLLTASENLNGQNGQDGRDVQNGLSGTGCDANGGDGGNGGHGGNCSGTVTNHHHKRHQHSGHANGNSIQI